ncbi:FAD-dependent monooxygenase [Arthrobacter sp. OV608]|uniref:FAD-dependent monooxygenase n=1 Tax=Arthrobacter sp. OV608 TaxID=1882768 RepID=UPI0008C258BC|nr:FAD-dependent monooxygenase [Arthrobacter sp. OV608]SEQ41932.1 2-polyprenyl-6-methoxyphenol hydroxylase [Arthrobacter sp. OV608]
MVAHRFASPEHIPAEVQILIAGGGPSGLFLALDLASRGIPSLVVEPRDAVDHARPRAKTTNARTMTHLRRLGLADALRAASPLPIGYAQDVIFCTGLTGPGAHELRRFRNAFQLEPGRYGPQPECGQQVPQPVLEEVLRAAVAASPLVTMVTGWSVQSVDDSGTGYTAVVSDASGAQRTITAEYVIGADGATSAVRRSLGIRLEGGSAALSNISILFRSKGLSSAVNLDPAVQYWVVGANTSGMLGPMDLNGTWWAIIQGVNPEETVDTAKAGGMVRSLVGADVDIEVLATDPWTARMLLAPEYRHGGVFLMGDAAHLNPPWGGHGFNTCVGDAANLAWKLAAVVTGWAGADLLDSYEAERRPVAARTISDAAANGKALAYHFADPALLADDPAGASARATAHEGLAVKQSEFDSLGLVLGYAYGDSPAVVPDGSPAPVEDPIVYVPSATPGALLPHAWLDGSASVYDLLGQDFTLLVDEDALAGRPAEDVFAAVVGAGKRKGIPVAIAAVGRFDDGTQPSELWGADAVLVRPDQHVAWRGSTAEAAADALAVAAGRRTAEDLDQNQHTDQEGEARVRVVVP